MLTVKLFLRNYILLAAIVSWLLAQVIKTVLTMIKTGKFVPERISGAGGMPSAHSAMVCALFVGIMRHCGVDSPEFALVFVLAAVVIYDAMGIRRAAGEQARVLNRLVEAAEKQGPEISQKELQEKLGHTPLEVLVGVMLGILVALVIG